MIPLLGNTELVSPTMMGVLSSKTADMLVQQGQSMANDIEKKSLTAEAQAKAPAITSLYSTAYQKIAAGDMTGFADMQKARSLGIGNPILMKTLDDADQIAGHLANEWIKSSGDGDKQKFALDKQGQLQDRIDARATDRESERYYHDDQVASTSIWKQEHAGWEKENYYGQKQYDADMQKWQKRQQAADEEAKITGQPAEQIPKPDKFTPRPEPVLEDYQTKKNSTDPASRGTSGGTALPSQLDQSKLDLPDPNASTLQPSDLQDQFSSLQAQYESLKKQGKKSQLPDLTRRMSELADQMDKQPDSTAPKAVPPAAAAALPPPTMKAPTMGLRPEGTSSSNIIPGLDDATPSVIPGLDEPKPKTVAKPATVPIPSSQLGSQATKPVAVQMGEKAAAGKPLENIVFGYNNGLGMVVSIHPPGAKLDAVKVDTEAGTVAKSYKISHDEEEARDLVSHFSSDENFAKWVAYQGRMGHQITFKQTNIGGKKGSETYIARTGDSEYKKQTLVNGVPTMVDETFTKDDADKWDKMRGLISNHVISIQHPPLDDDSKNVFRNQALNDAASNPTSFDLGDANRQLQKLGIKTIGPDDVKAAQDSLNQKAATQVQAKHEQKLDERVVSELQSNGFTVPGAPQGTVPWGTEAQRQAGIEQQNNSKARLAAIPGELKALSSQLEALKAKNGGKLEGADLEKAKAIQKKIIQTEDDKHWHTANTIQGNFSPIVGM